MTIKGYRIETKRTIYHNGKFSHHMTRTQLVEAQSSKEAKDKSTIRKEEENIVDENLTIYASEESFKGIECLGLRSYRQVKYYGDDPA